MAGRYNVIAMRKTISEQAVANDVAAFSGGLIKRGHATVLKNNDKYVITIRRRSRNAKKEKDMLAVTLEFQKDSCIVAVGYYGREIFVGILVGILIAPACFPVTIILYCFLISRIIRLCTIKKKILKCIKNYVS